MAKARVLFLTGGAYHDFQKCPEILLESFEQYGMLEIEHLQDRDALHSDNLARFDAILLFTQGGDLTDRQEEGLIQFVKGGGGLVGLHCASDSFVSSDAYVDMLGGKFITHSPVHHFQIHIDRPDHPITARISDFETTDELYVLERFDPRQVEVLATTIYQGRREPMLFVKQFGEGKVCYNALGHGVETFSLRTFQKLVHRGLRHVTTGLPAGSLRTGLVGYGPTYGMGAHHLHAMKNTLGLAPVAICDRDLTQVAQAKTDHPDLNPYEDLGAMLDDEQFDLLTIVTPHNTHAPLAIQSLEAGRHTIVEKPMAVGTAECDSMIESAERAGKMLSVYHNRRWDSDYMEIRDRIRRGEIGPVFQVELAHSQHMRPQSDWRGNQAISGGFFFDWGAHLVDWLLGVVDKKIISVEGFFQKKRWWHVDIDDHALVTIRFEDGIVGVVEQSHIAAAGRPKWRVLGARGGIQSDGWGESPVRMIADSEGRLVESSVTVERSLMAKNWQSYYANVADRILYGEPLAVTPRSARRVVSVIETAEKSSREGKPISPPGEEAHRCDRWV